MTEQSTQSKIADLQELETFRPHGHDQALQTAIEIVDFLQVSLPLMMEVGPGSYNDTTPLGVQAVLNHVNALLRYGTRTPRPWVQDDN